MGGRQRTTLFMGLGEGKAGGGQEKGKGEASRGAAKEKKGGK